MQTLVRLFDYDYPLILLAVIGFIFLLVLILLISCISLASKNKKLERRFESLLTGANGDNLEKDIASIIEDNDFLKKSVDRNNKEIKTLFDKLAGAYQKKGIIKYDAFSQMGGQLSFCLALLTNENDGFILNSVHSNEASYSYSKEIFKGTSTLPLSKEEEEALAMAMGDKR